MLVSFCFYSSFSLPIFFPSFSRNQLNLNSILGFILVHCVLFHSTTGSSGFFFLPFISHLIIYSTETTESALSFPIALKRFAFLEFHWRNGNIFATDCVIPLACTLFSLLCIGFRVFFYFGNVYSVAALQCSNKNSHFNLISLCSLQLHTQNTQCWLKLIMLPYELGVYVHIAHCVFGIIIIDGRLCKYQLDFRILCVTLVIEVGSAHEKYVQTWRTMRLTRRTPSKTSIFGMS